MCGINTPWVVTSCFNHLVMKLAKPSQVSHSTHQPIPSSYTHLQHRGQQSQSCSHNLSQDPEHNSYQMVLRVEAGMLILTRWNGQLKRDLHG